MKRPRHGGTAKRLFLMVVLGLSLLASLPATAQEVLRFTVNVPGDSKPIVMHADSISTWMEGGQRILLLKGKVLIEHGVVLLRMEQGAAWVDQEHYRQTGIMRVDVYAEGNVALENGKDVRSSAQALIGLNTRGEIKLRAQTGKVAQTPQSNDPLYRKALSIRTTRSQLPRDDALEQIAFQEIKSDVEPAPAATAVVQAGGNQEQPSGIPPQPQGPIAPPAGGSQIPPQVAQPAPPGSTPSPLPTGPATPTPPVPSPAVATAPAPGPPPPGGRVTMATSPLRQLSIVPRTAAGFDPRSIIQPDGQYVIFINGGITLLVRSLDNQNLVDIEADRLVIWTHNEPGKLLSQLRSTQGETTNEIEFYLEGNVEFREQLGPETRTLRADEFYYDVGRNVGVAMHADLEFREKNVPDPVHLRADELDRITPTLFKATRAEVFSSKLPSDPGLKLVVVEATVEDRQVPKRSIFGLQVFNRQTGEPEIQLQRLFDGRNVILKLEDTPVFWLPYVRGDANDPLGPLEDVSFGYNNIFGAQFTTVFNVYNLLGIDPIANTRWRLNLDYLTLRGPAAMTDFEYNGKSFLGLPARMMGEVKAFGINDTGTDELGGGRGPLDNHPEWRGWFYWQQNVQALPNGFSLQTQVSALSDPNFLEQYFPLIFNNAINQSTFIYLKQQEDNWAWTALVEPRIRYWVTETESLPALNGYLLGQSFFDIFTYNAHASMGYYQLQVSGVPPPPTSNTDVNTSTGRFDLYQELSAPFTLGPFRVAPYGVIDLTYYTEDLEDTSVGRVYGGGGARATIPFSRLYPEVQSDLLNVDGIYHKIVLGCNFFTAQSSVPHTQLPQLDQLNDNATDQAIRQITPIQPIINPAHGVYLQDSQLYDPQLFALRQLVDNKIDTLDTIEVLQMDLLQRWQTKRGYPGQEHIVDWMTLDLEATYFPHSSRDNFGANFAFVQYDWIWNVGDRTALVSNGWVDPINQGTRTWSFGGYLNRPDRTNFFLGYREIDPLNSRAIIGAVTYIFSPKYSITASALYDFGVNTQVTSFVLTRQGTDLQVSLGIAWNSILSTVGFTFEIVPNIVPLAQRIPGLSGLSPGNIVH
jgi:hypothetical protein